MKRSSYAFGSKVIAKTKIPQLLQRLAYHDEVTIITYHGIIRSPLAVPDWCFLDEKSFSMQIDYLKKHFDMIGLSEAVERVRRGEIKRPTAVITFDDGYQNNFDVAFPILRKEKVPATIFLTTGLIDTEDTLWHCRLNRALSDTRTPAIEWNGLNFDVSTADMKSQASKVIQEKLKRLPHPQLMATIRDIVLELGDDPDDPIGTDSPFRMLSQQAILEMGSSGLIEFGAHTHHHAILSRLSDRERYGEIKRSTDAVCDITKRPCETFAYPNGQAGDYDSGTIRDLARCRIQVGVTAIAGPNNRTTPAMELRRYGVGADLPMAEFQLMVHHFIARARRSIDYLSEKIA